MRIYAWVLGAMATLVSTVSAGNHTTDTLDTVKKNVADGSAVLVDVREVREWDNGHLKDAQNLPLSSLKKGLSAEEINKKIPKKGIIYLHCGSGVRCLTAADILKQKGYDVRPLKPGFDDLVEAGFPKAK